jgi:FAD synthetase
MAHILKVEEFSTQKLQIKHPLILTGGCFDILHIGHIAFFEELNALHGTIVVLLESDQTVLKLKGTDRPIHTQEERAKILSFLPVHYILRLDPINSNESYYRLVKSIKPDIIAITVGDPLTKVKEDQAKENNARLVEVPKYQKARSTSEIVSILRKEL